jgi:hypothetical protein
MQKKTFQENKAKNKIETLMLQNFPTCPLCKADKTGYTISGHHNNQVQCKTCQAKWTSDDFINGQEIKFLKLTYPSSNGKGKEFLNQTLSAQFWKDPPTTTQTNLPTMVQPTPEPTSNTETTAVNKTPVINNTPNSLQQSDTELKNSIAQEIATLQTMDVNKSIFKINRFLNTTVAENLTIMLLQANIIQNNILIKQNELLLRAQQNKEKMPE